MRRLGDLLLGLGLVVGIGAIVGYELDIIPPLPPAVLKLVLYKLVFVGGLGLLVAGAVIRRLATMPKVSDQNSALRRTSSDLDSVPGALPPPSESEILGRRARVGDKPPLNH
jgi:hypothetical protein